MKNTTKDYKETLDISDMAQSTGDFTREELKKDVKLS